MDRKPVKGLSPMPISRLSNTGKEMPNRWSLLIQFVSLTLENMYTETKVSPLPTDATAHEFYIDGNSKIQLEQAKSGAVIDSLKPADEAGFVQVDYQQQHASFAAGLSL